MRLAIVAASAVFITASCLAAQAHAVQAPAAQAQQPGSAPSLDTLLQGWEKALTSLQSVSMDCKRITKDRVFETTDEYRGTAKLARSAQANQSVRASLEL